MIDAKTARDISANSKEALNMFLANNIEPSVRKAAEVGRRRTEVLIKAKPSYLSHRVTEFEGAVIKELKAFGFTATINSYGDVYIPRGLQDDDGSGPEHINFGYIIEW